MASLADRRRRIQSAFLAMGTVFLIVALGCSVDARARRSFKKVVHKEIKQFNKYHKGEVKPNVYQSDRRFYRIYHERVEPVINMRRTNSIDTPYIATLGFTENIYRTRRRATQKEARQDVHFILANASKREVVYAFAGGSWKKKETY